MCQYDNFGLSFKVVGNGGTRATDAEVASQLLEAQFATEWARAETYCDVVSLSAQDLAEIFTKEKLWSKVAALQRRVNKESQPSPSLLTRIRRASFRRGSGADAGALGLPVDAAGGCQQGVETSRARRASFRGSKERMGLPVRTSAAVQPEQQGAG